MKCPVCSIDLSMTDRQGVEIDYCPKCRGVWLDRGNSTSSLSDPTHRSADLSNLTAITTTITAGKANIICPRTGSGRASWGECWILIRA